MLGSCHQSGCFFSSRRPRVTPGKTSGMRRLELERGEEENALGDCSALDGRPGSGVCVRLSSGAYALRCREGFQALH